MIIIYVGALFLHIPRGQRVKEKKENRIRNIITISRIRLLFIVIVVLLLRQLINILGL